MPGKHMRSGNERASSKSSPFPRTTFDTSQGNQEAARSACELWAQTYPHRDGPWLTLAYIYDSLGEYDKYLTATLEALRLNPGNGNVTLIWLSPI